MDIVTAGTTLIPWITLIGQIVLACLLVQLVYFYLTKKILWKPISEQVRLLGLLAVSTAATFGSLFYSDIAGYTPCVMCWYQRIMMYPQFVMYTMAFFTSDTKIKAYGILLSALGAVIALYHYLLQFSVVDFEICSAVGYSVSCSERFVASFGYITIPLMALTAFSLIITLWLLPSKNTKK